MKRVGTTVKKRKVPRVTTSWRAGREGGRDSVAAGEKQQQVLVRRRAKVGYALGRFAISSTRVIERSDDEKLGELEAGKNG